MKTVPSVLKGTAIVMKTVPSVLEGTDGVIKMVPLIHSSKVQMVS
jgi:hypothetical protein